MALPLILITGATGYLGGHIVQEALAAGYPVRITSRAAKIDSAKKQFGEKVEVVSIDDIVEGDYTEALRGVGAVIHAASPLAGREDVESMLKHAVGGATNILHQAAAAGIKRIVVTSSAATLGDVITPEIVYSDTVLSHNDWIPLTREIALAPEANFMISYATSKVLAEKEVWKFADEHPEVDITTIDPPFFYGPTPSGVKPAGKAAIGAYSTLGVFYQQALQEPGADGALTHPQMPSPLPIDIRDAARAHVLALKAPLEKEVGRKRLVVAGPSFTWRDAVERLKVSHPELAAQGRLKAVGAGKRASELKLMKFDTSRAEIVLGLKDYTSWEKTVDDMADSVIEAEK